MAAVFPSSGTPSLSHAAALLTAPPMTFALRFTRDVANVHHTLIQIGRSVTNLNSWAMYLSNTNVIRARTWQNNAHADSSGFTVSDANPHSCVVRFASATNRHCNLDGSWDTADTTSATPVNLDNTSIGGHVVFGGLNDALGHTVWDAGIWNIALSDADVAAYMAGRAANLIRPDALIECLPLTRTVYSRFGRTWTSSGLNYAKSGAVMLQAPRGGIGVPASQSVSGSGALAADAAGLSGSGDISAAGAGAVSAGTATLAGSARVAWLGSGSLSAGASSLVGSGALASAGTGALIGQESALGGSGALSAAGAGALTAQAAVLQGSGRLSAGGNGALAANAAGLSGSGRAAWLGEGGFAAQDSVMVGEGITKSSGQGALIAQDAIMAGSGLVTSATSTSTGAALLPWVYRPQRLKARKRGNR